jgi:hypothetical protein
MGLFLIFWAAYIIPIAIPLLWLVFTIVMHSRGEAPTQRGRTRSKYLADPESAPILAKFGASVSIEGTKLPR